eukprot:14456679-Alexandrium_andersonii.AAC.1
MSRLRTPSIPALFGRFGICAKAWRRMHPSGASGTKLEAVPGSPQSKLRTPEPYLRLREDGLRIEAECSTDRR